MTIKLKITNEDTRETAVVEVSSVAAESGAPMGGENPKELKGGESAEVWIHSGKHVHIKEIRND